MTSDRSRFRSLASRTRSVTGRGAALRAAAVGLAAAFVASACPGPGALRAQPAAAPKASAPQASAGGNLNISPKRVTLDRNHRSGAVYIFNQGGGPATFDISLVDRAMLPDGEIVALTEATASPATKPIADRVRSAQAILQASPHRTTLNPGQGQTIRLRVLAAPDDATAAEFRSHLTIATLPPRDSGTTAEAAAAGAQSGANELRFQINALFGLSVPVIVRQGTSDVRAALENGRVTYEPAAGAANASASRVAVLSVDIVRLGANSLFGTVEVRTEGQTKGEPLGMARGVGVYTEIDRRLMRMALTRAPAPGEHLVVTFTDDDAAPGKILAKLVL